MHSFLKLFLQERVNRETIALCLNLARQFVDASTYSAAVGHEVNQHLCMDHFLGKEDSYLVEKSLMQDYGVLSENILGGEMVSYTEVKTNFKQAHQTNLMLDQDLVGKSLLITEGATEVSKVNNFFNFKIDLHKAYRVNKFKLIFDEKSKKQLNFKMRVNFFVPDGAERMRLVQTQLFDENQIYHIN